MTIGLAIALGILYCFLGYRALKFVIFLTGFALAGTVACAIAAWASQGNPLVCLIAGLVGGILGAVAILVLYKVGVFCLGLMAGALIAQTVLAGRGDAWVVWAVIGAGGLGGLVALVLERPIMTLATAALGAWMIVSGAAFFYVGPGFFDGFDEPFVPGSRRFWLVTSWAALALTGLLFQFVSTKRHPTRVVVREAKDV
ncbi:MAG: DUF4203 domain-containing protein [Candidatus Hydrogenedentes bacterium]|nr:DUF4203 domain-containing protein [Candidatus Hydrogenedentota bacterium]